MSAEVHLEADRKRNLLGGIGGLISSMCTYLDKSSVAQFLDRSLKGRPHFPSAEDNSATGKMQQQLLTITGLLSYLPVAAFAA
jgi:hypothetical protein